MEARAALWSPRKSVAARIRGSSDSRAESNRERLSPSSTQTLFASPTSSARKIAIKSPQKESVTNRSRLVDENPRIQGDTRGRKLQTAEDALLDTSYFSGETHVRKAIPRDTNGGTSSSRPGDPKGKQLSPREERSVTSNAKHTATRRRSSTSALVEDESDWDTMRRGSVKDFTDVMKGTIATTGARFNQEYARTVSGNRSRTKRYGEAVEEILSASFSAPTQHSLSAPHEKNTLNSSWGVSPRTSSRSVQGKGRPTSSLSPTRPALDSQRVFTHKDNVRLPPDLSDTHLTNADSEMDSEKRRILTTERRRRIMGSSAHQSTYVESSPPLAHVYEKQQLFGSDGQVTIGRVNEEAISKSQPAADVHRLASTLSQSFSYNTERFQGTSGLKPSDLAHSTRSDRNGSQAFGEMSPMRSFPVTANPSPKSQSRSSRTQRPSDYSSPPLSSTSEIAALPSKATQKSATPVKSLGKLNLEYPITDKSLRYVSDRPSVSAERKLNFELDHSPEHTPNWEDMDNVPKTPIFVLSKATSSPTQITSESTFQVPPASKAPSRSVESESATDAQPSTGTNEIVTDKINEAESKTPGIFFAQGERVNDVDKAAAITPADSQPSLKANPDDNHVKWEVIADLLDLSGYNGDVFRVPGPIPATSSVDRPAQVEQALSQVLKDFNRQKVIIERSLNATRKENEIREEYERQLQSKQQEVNALRARLKGTERSIGELDQKLSASKASEVAQGLAPSALERKAKQWETRCRRFEEDYSRLQATLERELEVAEECRKKAREEFERLLGRKASTGAADLRVVDILEGFLQERLHGVSPAIVTSSSSSQDQQASDDAVLTERSKGEVYTFAKRVCELVMAHADSDDHGALTVLSDEDFVDGNGGWFPTSIVSRVVPQISRWIAQAKEVDRLMFWREQILQELSAETEELALKALRKMPRQ